MSDVEQRHETPPPHSGEPSDEHAGDDSSATLHVTSLRTTPHTFSMRRLLNVASVAVAAVLLVALAIHWLPGLLASRSGSPVPTSNTLATPPARGAGWKPIGPDWAQDISFTSNGALGYACGAFPPNPNLFVAVYDVHQKTWKNLPSPASGSSCLISVSPFDPMDVVLVAFGCDNCNGTDVVEQVFRSHDGGGSWTLQQLPSSLFYVTDIDWTALSVFLTAIDPPSATSTFPARYFLLVSRADNPFAEITAQQLLGRSLTFGKISVESSGRTVYVEADDAYCVKQCTVAAQSDTEGIHWTAIPPTYQGNPLVPVAAQLNSNTLIGWSFLPQSGTLVVVRSPDNGKSWQTLPELPANPATGGDELFVVPDGSIYAWNYGSLKVVYALTDGATSWRMVAPQSLGAPLAIQYDAHGHAVALWGQAHGNSGDSETPGLVYYPLSAPTR